MTRHVHSCDLPVDLLDRASMFVCCRCGHIAASTVSPRMFLDCNNQRCDKDACVSFQLCQLAHVLHALMEGTGLFLLSDSHRSWCCADGQVFLAIQQKSCWLHADWLHNQPVLAAMVTRVKCPSRDGCSSTVMSIISDSISDTHIHIDHHASKLR